MNSISFFPRYFFWHYTQAFKNLFGIWKNYLWFVYNFFSLPLLVKTIFAPWQKMDEGYKKGLDLAAFGSTLVVNTLMRLVGAVMRTIVIIIGAVSLAVVFCLGLAFFVVWTLYPLIVIFLITRGLLYFF